MFYCLSAVLVFVLVFIWWRFTSVARGTRNRDLALLKALDPIHDKLKSKQPVSDEDIRPLADRWELRTFLYAMLQHFDMLDLFPVEYLARDSQAKSQLAYWMMHPNEMKSPPIAMESVSICRREIDGRKADFHVIRFRMPTGHWAGKDDWLLGLAGPFFAESESFEPTGAFARCSDKDGDVDPEELVDWYLRVVCRKKL